MTSRQLKKNQSNEMIFFIFSTIENLYFVTVLNNSEARVFEY